MGELSWMAWALEGWFAPLQLPPGRAAHLPLPGELAIVVWVQESCPNPQWPWDNCLPPHLQHSPAAAAGELALPLLMHVGTLALTRD